MRDSYTKTLKGHKSWDTLIGQEVFFTWSDGYEHDYWVVGEVEGTRVYAEDPRYPRYYVELTEGGGYSFWETEEVKVSVYV